MKIPFFTNSHNKTWNRNFFWRRGWERKGKRKGEGEGKGKGERKRKRKK